MTRCEPREEPTYPFPDLRSDSLEAWPRCEWMDRTNLDSAEVQTRQRAPHLPQIRKPEEEGIDRRWYHPSLATDPSH